MAGHKLSVIFIAFGLAFFLVSLDQTILSTALPHIASHFNAVSDLSWIASGYYLPQAAFMLFFGKILAFLPAKGVFMISIVIFELGSLLSAVSPSTTVLILGRAVSGFGGTGLYMSIMSIVARITTLKQRPLMMSIFGGVYAASSLGGPVIGGAFSDKVTWRWCFYINLPVGGLALIAVMIWLPYLPAMEKERSILASWMYLDWIGTLLSFTMVTFLLIALQWGGSERPWDDGLIISFLVLAVVIAAVFVLWEHWMRDRALLPVDMILRRNVLGASLSALFGHLAFVIFTYYLPLLYQVRGHSATRSGVDIFPFMIAGVLASIVSGGVTSHTGWAWPFLFFAPLVAAAGFGVFFTFTQATPSARLAGLQIIVGVGLGCVTQLPIVVAQAEYADQEHLVPQVTSLATFLQLIGSSVGLAVSGAVFSEELTTQLNKHASELSAATLDIVRSNVEAIFSLPPAQKLEAADAYVATIQRVWLICVPSAALASLVALIIKRERIRKVEGM